MLRNEIDDTAPPRCLVHTSTVVDAVPSVGRPLSSPLHTFVMIPRDSDIALVNDLSDKGLKMVLFGYEGDPVTPEAALKEIDLYQHPFNEWLVFPDLVAAMRYLATQNDVRYVIDRRRPLGFGSRSLHV